MTTEQQDFTVLITGANKGIGFEFVRQYAALGWQVIAVPWRSSDTDWDQFDVVFGKFNVDRIIVKPVVSTNATDAFLLERENLADLEQTLSKVFPGWPFVA